jgi:uncharacterized protein YcaQ
VASIGRHVRMLNSVDDLRSLAVANSLFSPTTLKRALNRLGFVQADPIRAPARAQDLMLRHRVTGYRAGDLDRRYEALGIEEDVFINYGFVTRSLQALMHPRPDVHVPAAGCRPWPAAQRMRAQLLVEFILERGTAHPREVDDHFSHGTVKNYWGGSSNATTHLLDAMQYRGMLRVVRRDAGIRVYGAHQHQPGLDNTPGRLDRIDQLVDVAVRIYAPLPSASLSFLLRRLRYATPQWRGELKGAIERAKHRLSHARIDGFDWYWPPDAVRCAPPNTVRLLAPFDPVVWDRDRFELLWGWKYRFEAYTPAPKRKLGYYALPLLWRDRVIGWSNISVKDGELRSEFGYVESESPRDRGFKRELAAEMDRMRAFLSIKS